MKLNNGISQSFNGFTFSGVRPETLGSVEYTLVTLVLDKTGSVNGFENDLFKIKGTVVEACQKNTRADYILLRVVEFNDRVDEVHGFMPLADIDSSTYSVPVCQGMTALNDAVYSSVEATVKYSKTLADSDYLTNAIVIVVTDGDDNRSKMTSSDVAKSMKSALKSESLESLRAVLIGVNTLQYSNVLSNYSKDVGFDQYEDIGNASSAKLAKLAAFVSKSISTQSQSLGSGGPSQALTF